MTQSHYVVKDPLGLHFGHAGQIARLTKEYPDTLITITKGPEVIKADRAMKLLMLGLKSGDAITLSCDGEYEQNAIEGMGNLISDIL